MTSRGRCLLFSVPCLLLLSADLTAQTSQRLSVQGSALYADIYGDNFFAVAGGFGFEAQLRYTPGVFSIGGGLQYTHHNDSQAQEDGYEGDIALKGFFVEPRYTFNVGKENAAPYLAARFAIAQLDLWNRFTNGNELTWMSPGVTLNLGGGVLIRVARRANVDIGASAGFTRYNNTDGEETSNGTVVNRFNINLGSGTNLVFRVGLALGLGG